MSRDVEPPAVEPASRLPWRDRLGQAMLFSRRHRAGLLLTVALASGLIGVAVGRASAPGAETPPRTSVEAELLPLALDADGIWTSGFDGGPPVSEALAALRRDGDPSLVEAHHERWLQSYESILVQLSGVDLPVGARPVQRQFIAAVTLSRDAVEVLVHAAGTSDELHRLDLTTEAGRLRQRSEQLMQSARASTAELGGQRADVSPLPDPTTFREGRS